MADEPGTRQSLSSGRELDLFEVIGDLMSGVVIDAFQPVVPAAHQPPSWLLSWALCDG
jgi:hypothetical protein